MYQSTATIRHADADIAPGTVLTELTHDECERLVALGAAVRLPDTPVQAQPAPAEPSAAEAPAVADAPADSAPAPDTDADADTTATAKGKK